MQKRSRWKKRPRKVPRPDVLPDRTRRPAPDEVEAILSILKRQSATGWLFVLLCLAIGLLLRRVDDGSVSIAATFFMFFSPFGALAHVKARHDRTLIERVATSFGLEREDLGMEFVSRLESPMFPQEETPTLFNRCSRLVGANKISVADVQTRGKGEGADHLT